MALEGPRSLRVDPTSQSEKKMEDLCATPYKEITMVYSIET